MKNKIFTRIVLCLIAAAMLVTCFVGCKKDEEEKQGNETTVATETGDGIHDANGYLLDALPDDLDYEGVDINILGWNSEVTEYEVAELGGVAIDESIYRRNESIEARLNVNLVFDLSVLGHNAVKAEYAQHVERSIGSGAPYDVISAHTGSIARCANLGLMTDLGGIEDSYMDFEKPWWSQDLIEKTSIGSTFFYCTGDISTSFVQMIYCIYFNEDMINDNKLDSPYDLVENNEWTYENMIQMGMNIYHDNNENDAVDLADTVPLIGKYFDWPSLLEGCGISFVEKDISGAFVLTEDIKGEKSLNVMNKLSNFVQLDRAIVGSDPDDTRGVFLSGRSLFWIVQNGAAARWSLSDNNITGGCVPLPKFDSDQENYRCAVRKPISLFGMPNGMDPERAVMVTAVLECYASESYRQTTPVIFDQVMKYQKSTNETMSDMLNLISESAVFDVGRLYGSELSGICDEPGYYLRGNKPWENYINQKIPLIETLLGELSDSLVENANN